MADGFDPFAPDNKAEAFDPFAAEGAAAPAVEAQPLNTLDRYVLQFIFDTQPKRQAQYLKQKGWEVDPKDSNKLRPMGSTGEFDTQIDPGGFFNFKQYLPKNASKEEIASALNETFGDVNEGILDMVQGALIEGVGAAGAVAGGVAGGIPGAAAGRSIGRSTAFNMLESAKDMIGDMLLDTDIPPDYKLRAIQTGIQAVAPEALAEGFKFGTKAASKALSAPFKAVSQGVKNLLTWGGGKIDDIAFQRLAKDPKTFANYDAIKGADERIGSFVNNLYGVGPEEAIPNKIMPGSAFQQKLDLLEGERKKVVNQLSQDSRANPNLSEIMAPLKRQLTLLNDKKVKNEEDKAGIRWLSEQLESLSDMLKVNGKVVKRPENVVVPFSEADQFVKTWQKDLYAKDNPWRNTIRQTIDGGEGVPGVNDLLKTKANFAMQENPAISQSYAAIKQSESKVFDAFDAAKRNLTRESARRRIVGGPETATKAYGEIGINLPGATGAKQEGIDAALEVVDDALGTQIAPGLQQNQIQKQIFDAMESTSAQGSSKVLPIALAAGAAGMKVAGPAGAAVAVPAAVALSTPRVGLPVMARSAQLGQAIEQGVSSMAEPIASRLRGPLGAAAAQDIGAVDQTQALQDYLQRLRQPQTEDQFDPFAEE